MKECKISKYLSVKKVLGAKNFKRNKMIQNGTEISGATLIPANSANRNTSEKDSNELHLAHEKVSGSLKSADGDIVVSAGNGKYIETNNLLCINKWIQSCAISIRHFSA